MAVPADRSGREADSRNEHFTKASQRSLMGAVIASRKADQDALTFPEPPGDD